MPKRKYEYPQWVLDCKQAGTEIRCISGKYYVYRVWSEYNKETKKAKKKTGACIGKITQQDGFVESDKARLQRQQITIDKVEVKEYGITTLFDTIFKEIVEHLQEHFPDDWQTIIALVYGRFVYNSPMKNILFNFSNSYLSTIYKDIDLSKNGLTKFLNKLGQGRISIVNFFKSFASDADSIIFDGSDIFSKSNKMDLVKFGKSKFGTFDNLINLMFLFSVNNQMPYYYRLLPGNIKDIKAFKFCLKESGVENSTIIIDKGFFSKSNIDEMERSGLNFIIPLKRDDKMIDYNRIKDGNKQNFDGHFLYNKRYIWHLSYNIDEYKDLHIFLDNDLKNEEEHDFLKRIDTKNNKNNMDKFYDKQNEFGTIAMFAKKGLDPKKVYVDYKTRGNVETMIDAFKNNFDADRTYMQNQQSLEAWMFVNFLALMLYYKVLNLLKEYDLNSQYSPNDFIMFLREIKKVKLNENLWVDTERTNATDKIIAKLKILSIP